MASIPGCNPPTASRPAPSYRLRRAIAAYALTAAFLVASSSGVSPAAQGDLTLAQSAPTPTGTGTPRPTLPPDARPPGEREPLIGFLAVASIVAAAVAGVYVYRVIRKGL